MRVHDRWSRARFRERTWRGGRRSCLGTKGGGTGGESQERRTRRCSRPRGPVGFPRCVAHSAPAAAELGRSVARGGGVRRAPAQRGGVPPLPSVTPARDGRRVTGWFGVGSVVRSARPNGGAQGRARPRATEHSAAVTRELYWSGRLWLARH